MSSIWVGSFPDDTTRYYLEKAFSSYGTVYSCEIKTQSTPSGESRYAFVNFDEEDSADKALDDQWVKLPSGAWTKVAPAKRRVQEKGKMLNRQPLARARPPPTDCTFFLFSSCKTGDNCSFRHSEDVKLKKPAVCNAWRVQNCLKWECPYYHAKIIPQDCAEPDAQVDHQPKLKPKQDPQQHSVHSTQPSRGPAWREKVHEDPPRGRGSEAVIIVSGIWNPCNHQEVTNIVRRAAASAQLKTASIQVIFSSYQGTTVIIAPDGEAAKSSVVVSGFDEELQVIGDERWRVEVQHWTPEKKEHTLSRSNMIECLLSCDHSWTRLEDFSEKCSARFNLVVTEETIRARCSGVIEILLDDTSDHTMNVVVFSDLNPLATVDEEEVTSLKEKIAELIKSAPNRTLNLLDIPALYTEEYGRLPLIAATGKTCVKDVIRSVCSLQGSKLSKTKVTLHSLPDNTSVRATTQESFIRVSSDSASAPPPLSVPPAISLPSVPLAHPQPVTTSRLVTAVIPPSTTVPSVNPQPVSLVIADTNGVLDQPSRSKVVMSDKGEREENKQAPKPRAPEVKAPRDPVLRLADIQKPLTKESYKDKFGKLLLWEENEQRLALRRGCERCETILIFELPTGESPYETLGSIRMDCDVLAYVKEVASARGHLVLEQGTRLNGGQFLLQEDVTIRVKLLFDDPRDAGKLTVVLNEEDVVVLSDFLSSEGSLEAPVLLRLDVGESMFPVLRNAVATMPASVVRRILPEQHDFSVVHDRPLSEGLDPFTNGCTPDQKLALRSLLSVPPNGPPFLLLGTGGTGKTLLLVTAVCSFVLDARDRGFPLRVLVCTRDHTLASDFLERFHTSFSNISLPELRVVQLVPEELNITWPHREEHMCTVQVFRGERDAILRHECLFVVSTYDTLAQIVNLVPSGFFTHVLLDDCGHLIEPECIIPLHLIGGYTQVVICGNERQVGTDLVLGEETCQNGLQVSLLKRLHTRYERYEMQSSPFEARLITEHRSHPDIVKFVGQVFYNMDLQATSPSTTHPDVAFPLVFMCSGVEEEGALMEDGVDRREAEVMLEVVRKFATTWPEDLWGKRDLSEMCIMTPSWNQLSDVSKQLKENRAAVPGLKSLSMHPYCSVQSRQFRAVFVSTAEPTEVLADGSVNPSNTTKSICDPFVFNTVMTCAQSLVVCVGNPFLLLRLEQSMVKKYGDRGRCWSHYLRACLDHDTVLLHNSQLSAELLSASLVERIERGGDSLSSS